MLHPAIDRGASGEVCWAKDGASGNGTADAAGSGDNGASQTGEELTVLGVDGVAYCSTDGQARAEAQAYAEESGAGVVGEGYGNDLFARENVMRGVADAAFGALERGVVDGVEDAASA